MSIYNWSPKDGSKADRYPPHLDLIPSTDEVPIYKIFDAMRLLVSYIFYVYFLELSVHQTCTSWYSAERMTSMKLFDQVGLSDGSDQGSRS